jgi:hypothetical protein
VDPWPDHERPPRQWLAPGETNCKAVKDHNNNDPHKAGDPDFFRQTIDPDFCIFPFDSSVLSPSVIFPFDDFLSTIRCCWFQIQENNVVEKLHEVLVKVFFSVATRTFSVQIFVLYCLRELELGIEHSS